MKKISHTLSKKLIAIFIMAILGILILTLSVSTAEAPALAENETSANNIYSFSTLLSCKDKSGYSNPASLSASDPLVGVKVANIDIKNFSSTIVKDGTRYFLKTNPDVPSLSISLHTDLNNLGGTGAWVNDDGDTRIPSFDYVGSSIGYGWLGITHTDYQGKTQTICVKDIFKKLKNENSYTPAWFGKEGSYNLMLSFEVKRQTGSYKKWHGPFYYTNDPVYSYYNYCITARFEIRNANAQIFAFDDSGNELMNGSVCQGFTLDFADTHYLQMNIKREIAVGENALDESHDVRSNTVAVDQRRYQKEGIYTIKASNPITGAKTTRRILVVPANATESEANNLLNAAAENYDEFSSLKTAAAKNNDPVEPINNDLKNISISDRGAQQEGTSASKKETSSLTITLIICGSVLIAILIVSLAIVLAKRRR